jgi:hypothetical protein
MKAKRKERKTVKHKQEEIIDVEALLRGTAQRTPSQSEVGFGCALVKNTPEPRPLRPAKEKPEDHPLTPRSW